jgi:hypothetical protein
MPMNYYVKQGDHMALIADANGFHDFQTIWDDPANADLKTLRVNPHTLLPGDLVVIPDKADHTESRPSGARHKFTAKAAPLTLQLTIQDATGQPVANAPVRLDVDGSSNQITADGQGTVRLPIPNAARGGKLVVQTDALDCDLTLSIGELDPLETVTGKIGRLNNLGYDAGEAVDPAVATDPDAATMQLRSAVEEFQCDQKLTVDGICGPQTQAKLKAVHGC